MLWIVDTGDGVKFECEGKAQAERLALLLYKAYTVIIYIKSKENKKVVLDE